MEHLSEAQITLLNQYAERIHHENSKFNLTGYKSVAEVQQKLMQESILDLKSMGVPRGTSCVDMGTGSGVPGVVLAILNPDKEFTLLDSNDKKIGFINSSVKELKIDNVLAVSCRIEDYAKEHKREYGFAFSRAFGPLYYSLEFGLSMLRQEGLLFIYSHYVYQTLSKGLRAFAEELGAREQGHTLVEGILLSKLASTPEKYPRRFPVIKREAKRIPEVE